jgi:DNA-directed RNA polymerase specialized sigma24 family protein
MLNIFVPSFDAPWLSQSGADRAPARVIPLRSPSAHGGRGPASIVDELYRQHARYLAGVVFRMLGDASEVDDVLQEVFCVALEQLSELSRVDELRGWLAVVATRAAGKRLRRRRLLRALGFQDDPDYDNVAGNHASLEDRIELSDSTVPWTG